MAEEMLHDRILRQAFLADTERPTGLSSEDVFWKLEDAQLGLVQIKDCLEWLVRRGDMGIDRSKYVLTKEKFFELKRQFGHVGAKGITIWLAPIAPIHVPIRETVKVVEHAAVMPLPLDKSTPIVNVTVPSQVADQGKEDGKISFEIPALWGKVMMALLALQMVLVLADGILLVTNMVAADIVQALWLAMMTCIGLGQCCVFYILKKGQWKLYTTKEEQ